MMFSTYHPATILLVAASGLLALNLFVFPSYLCCPSVSISTLTDVMIWGHGRNSCFLLTALTASSHIAQSNFDPCLLYPFRFSVYYPACLLCLFGLVCFVVCFFPVCCSVCFFLCCSVIVCVVNCPWQLVISEMVIRMVFASDVRIVVFV